MTAQGTESFQVPEQTSGVYLKVPTTSVQCPLSLSLCINFISHEAQAGWPPLVSGEDVVYAQNE